MNKHTKIAAFLTATLVSTALTSSVALAGDHSKVGVWGNDQSVSEGTVTAKKVMAE